METLVFIVALITLLVALTTLCVVVLMVYQQGGIEAPALTNPFTKKTTNTPANDVYTPDYAEATTQLEDFEPDFSRPITVKVSKGNESTEFVTGEGEQLTPLATDDLQEEEHEDKR